MIILNNKSNLTREEFVEYQSELSKIKSKQRLVLCPSTIHIANFYLENFHLGSQNVSKDKNGSHTGEVSSLQLKSFDVEYCLVGHSERREEFNETNSIIKKKIENLLEEEIIPILCIGEYIKEDSKTTIEVLKKQISTTLKGLTEKEKNKIIIAYEPRWAIGTGKTAQIEEINHTLKEIKELLPNNLLLYGGGVTEHNISNLKKTQFLDGYLLGSLSLDPIKFKKFLQELEK